MERVRQIFKNKAAEIASNLPKYTPQISRAICIKGDPGVDRAKILGLASKNRLLHA